MKISLIDKIRNNSTIKDTSLLSESKFFLAKDMAPTNIPAINVALSGRVDGGITPGLTMWAGPSKHFKTMFGLIMAKAYMTKYPDAVMLFMDSEFGTPLSYFHSMKIDTARVVHTPITDIELLKFDIMQQLSKIERGDRVIIVIDSIGNLASKKEVDDALDGKSAADMSRAKQLKSLFRMVTPHLSIKDIPMVVVNHTYKTLEMYSKDVVGGGTGAYYAADNIFIIGRQQDKDDKELLGYHFVINVEKSRYLKEKSKIPITVSFDSGINKWSGLLDLALEGKFLAKPKQGWYARVDQDTGEIMGKNYRAAEIVDNGDFWKSIFEETSFAAWIKNHYSLGSGTIMSEDRVDDED